MRSVAVILIALLAATPSGGLAQASLDRACDLCHGELEFLRQRVSTLEEARALLAPADVVLNSAHRGLRCGECHRGIGPYPHREDMPQADCASCHREAASLWGEGVHALEEGASCGSCHGIHDVLTVEELGRSRGRAAMNESCTACHRESGFRAEDPHADEATCAGCHRPHDTRSVDDPEAWIATDHQVRVCAGCHDADSPMPPWNDAHRAALEREGEEEAAVVIEAAESPPTCTTCHGAHPMQVPRGRGAAEIDAVCAECHEEYGESFADSYHGQARELGAERVAGCASCHTGHAIHPADDPRSSVSPDSLIQTCGECHEQASANFVGFQPHATHHDREKYPAVYWTTKFMQLLLLGVFAVFGAHSLLWIGRLTIDALRLPGEGKGQEGR